MDLLPYERSTALWHRAAYLHRRLQRLLDVAPPDALDPASSGSVTQLLYALRARSRSTQYRTGRGREARARDLHRQGPGGRGTEQAVFDLVADGLASDVAIGDDPGQRSVAA